jgi:hypothetical protein
MVTASEEAGLASGMEYQNIMRQTAVVQSQLLNPEQELLLFQQGEKRLREREAKEAVGDQYPAWRHMGELAQKYNIPGRAMRDSGLLFLSVGGLLQGQQLAGNALARERRMSWKASV